jgi:hypothetical protein
MYYISGMAQESSVHKCLKNLQSSKDITNFKLSLVDCSGISNVMKILGVLPKGCLFSKWPNLENLSLNFEL